MKCRPKEISVVLLWDSKKLKKKKMRMFVWICMWWWCPGTPGNLLGAGSLCGDNMVTAGSLALSLES